MPRRVTGAPPVRHYAPLPVFRPALGSPFTGIPRRIPIVSGSLGEEALLLLLFVFGLIEWMYYSTLFSVCQGFFLIFSIEKYHRNTAHNSRFRKGYGDFNERFCARRAEIARRFCVAFIYFDKRGVDS